MDEYKTQNQAPANPIPNSLVSIVKANDYKYPGVVKALEKSLELIGGGDKIIGRDDNVFVKINHLPPPSTPEMGIVTHPVFVKAVVDILKTTGANITVGDDIGIEPVGQSDQAGIDGFSVSGIRQVCQESGVTICNLRERGFIETACDGVLLDRVYVAKAILEADVIVNLPKLKTHAFTTYTGGIKNMFGAIPKGQRLRYHDKYHYIDDFNQMLVDVFSAVKPDLTIIDGITAMEGTGPSSGKLRNLGLILASRDTVALDAVVIKITGLKTRTKPITELASERGLGNHKLENIEIVGENISDVALTDFRMPDTEPAVGIFMRRAPKFLVEFVNNLSIVKPKVLRRLCVGCSECRNTCPVNAITIIEDKAHIDQRICIMCYCCYEACRYEAIQVKQPAYKRLIRNSLVTLKKIAGKILRKLPGKAR